MIRLALVVGMTVALAAQSAKYCPEELFLAVLPAEYRVLVSSEQRERKRFQLLREGYTNSQIEAHLLGWRKDLCLAKFLSSAQSEPVRAYLHSRGVSNLTQQRVVLSILAAPELGKLMRQQVAAEDLWALEDTLDAFQIPTQAVAKAIAADLSRLQSPDPIWQSGFRCYEQAFHALSDRTDRTTWDLEDEFNRACFLGNVSVSAPFGEGFVEYLRFVDPLFFPQ